MSAMFEVASASGVHPERCASIHKFLFAFLVYHFHAYTSAMFLCFVLCAATDFSRKRIPCLWCVWNYSFRGKARSSAEEDNMQVGFFFCLPSLLETVVSVCVTYFQSLLLLMT